MAPAGAAPTILSPAELSYLHSSLSSEPPIRPDGRNATQFRPVIAETDILPSTNGSARVCFADGTEAVVGVKAEVEANRPEKSPGTNSPWSKSSSSTERSGVNIQGSNSCFELSVELPGYRDDDGSPMLLSSLLMEPLLSARPLLQKLEINNRFHWRLYVDVLLLSPPLSFPLPLLSIATNLALLSTRLPKLVSEQEEDPLFDDDWEASTYLCTNARATGFVPPITLLAVTVGSNVFFDPTREEIMVADSLYAISVAVDENSGAHTLVSMQSLDAPSRTSPLGIPASMSASGDGTRAKHDDIIAAREANDDETVWTPPRGGLKPQLLSTILKKTLGPGGVAEEILASLSANAFSL